MEKDRVHIYMCCVRLNMSEGQCNVVWARKTITKEDDDDDDNNKSEPEGKRKKTDEEP